MGVTTGKRGEAGSGHNRPSEARVRGAGRNGDEAWLLQEVYDHEQLRPSRPRWQFSRGAIISSSSEALLVILKREDCSVPSVLSISPFFFSFYKYIDIDRYFRENVENGIVVSLNIRENYRKGQKGDRTSSGFMKKIRS